MKTRLQLFRHCSIATLAVAAAPFVAVAADLSAIAPPAPTPVFANLPAVDGINGKAEMFGGANNIYYNGLSSFPGFAAPFSSRDAWRGVGGGAGSISAPLGHSFGAQFDTIVAPWNGYVATGGAGHIFWRDPAVALLGVYGSGLYWGGQGGVSVGRIAGEGEGYFGSFTVRGLVGAEFLGLPRPANSAFLVTPFGAPYISSPINHVQPARFFDKVTFSYYLTEDLDLSVGHVYTGGRNAAALGLEYLIPQTRGAGVAASLFVEGRIGERHSNSVLGGLRVYFGNSDKSLIRRHREDDPPTYFNNDFNTLSNTIGPPSNTPLPTPQPAPPPPPG